MGELLRIATDPQLYDNVTVDWNKEGRGLNSPNRRHYWSYLQPFARAWQNKRILDIGAGTGWLLDVLVREIGVQSAIGIDPSVRNIALARKLYPSINMTCTTLQGFAPKEQFDVALSVLSLLHIHPLKAAYEKVSQLLAPKGIFMAVVPDYDYFRTPRKGRVPQIEDLGLDECVTMIPREYGTVADIVRRTSFYEEVAKGHGLTLTHHIPMPAAQEDRNRHPELASMTVTHLLKFENICCENDRIVRNVDQR